MMETNKYYKPSLEEFHVGFELEIKTHELRPWEKHTWLPGDQAKSVSNYLDQIRVKYLDSEDIENLGFSQMQLPCDYVKNNYILYYNVNKNRVRILDLDIVNEGNAVFNGIIRNKSELKRILKMIGAIE